ncbi:MAG: hypothetical protein H6581_19135 [Bacteroidia bacterium]|nr:hypothetical protein [Bacteroidia bacterium]
MGKIRIEVASVTCRRTEDLLSGDDLYYISSLKASSPAERESPENPIPDDRAETRESSRIAINKGDTKTFPDTERILFQSGNIASDQAVTGSLYWFDDDQGSIEKNLYDRMMFGILGVISILIGWGSLALTGMPKSTWATVGGVAGFALLAFFILWVLGQVFYHKVMNSPKFLDKDDFLGGQWLNIPAQGPAEEPYTFKVVGSKTPIKSVKGKNYTKSWPTDYTVVLRITRA